MMAARRTTASTSLILILTGTTISTIFLCKIYVIFKLHTQRSNEDGASFFQMSSNLSRMSRTCTYLVFSPILNFDHHFNPLKTTESFLVFFLVLCFVKSNKKLLKTMLFCSLKPPCNIKLDYQRHCCFLFFFYYYCVVNCLFHSSDPPAVENRA